MNKETNNPLGVKDHIWKSIVSKYTEAGAYDLLRSCPYQLAINLDVSFSTIDEYVMTNTGIDAHCPARIRNGLQYLLSAIERGTSSDTETSDDLRRLAGSTCIPKSSSYSLLEDLFGFEEDSIEMPLLDRVIKSLAVRGKISVNRVNGQIYLANKDTYAAEREAASAVTTLLGKAGFVKPTLDAKKTMYDIVDTAQAMTGLILSQEQKNAVCMVLQNRISVLTGGPGTGKSATQKVLVESFRLLKPNGTIRCIAPTGQAASRMHEATGYSATTIHKALGINPEETVAKKRLMEDLVLVDESSMIDIHVFKALVTSLAENTSIVFIGDPSQLPSIACGNVLDDLLSTRVPCSRLTKVFRQGDNSIAFNCARIKNGNTDLEIDDSFEFIECKDSKSISKTVCDIYAKEVSKNGLDSVCCLTPYRRKTKTGVNSLNRAIRSKLHDISNLTWCEHDGIRIYSGDKIVFTRNKNGLVNGDIGTAVKCTKGQCICRFGDREIVLKGDDLKAIDSAYAQTTHKAQGQEYKTCIIVIDEEHSSFLNKGQIYTAISRARQKCICVGSKETLKRAIGVNGGSRLSCLSGMIG